MTRLDDFLLLLAIGIDMIGPVVLLLILRRRTRRRAVALVGTIVLAPWIAFLVTGGVAWLLTYLRVVVRGDTTIPDEIGTTVPEYLWRAFFVCGVYGVMFASVGSVAWLPILLVWRSAHPPSFCRVWRIEPDRPRSPEEQDYGDAGPKQPPDAPPSTPAAR